MSEKPIIAIGDTHGELGKVETLLEILKSRELLENHTLVFLGDFLDRGPSVCGLVELLALLQEQGHVILMGNHEFVLTKAMMLPRGEDKETWSELWYTGGYENQTLESYGLGYWRRVGLNVYSEAAELLKQRLILEGHYDFITTLPLYHEQGGMIFIHAGIKPNIPWIDQKLMMLSDPEPPQIFSARLSRQIHHDENKIVVSGHSRVNAPIVTPKRLMLDTGCGNGGKLSAWISDFGEIISV